jgi:hypothetical protein
MVGERISLYARRHQRAMKIQSISVKVVHTGKLHQLGRYHPGFEYLMRLPAKRNNALLRAMLFPDREWQLSLRLTEYSLRFEKELPP